jgi:hypothetical protein
MAIWNILWIFGIFYAHLVRIVFIWYIFQVLVPCTKKNLANLHLGTTLSTLMFQLAVLVYIHGGRWLVGSANSKFYSPIYLIDQVPML